MTTTFRKLSLLAAATVATSALMTANVLAEAENCYYTDKFSEEAPGRADCEPGYAVRGMTCDGRYCDDKQLNCCADHLPTLDPSNRKDSPWFSDPSSYLDVTRVLTGLACRGRYCDDLQMRMYGFRDGLPLKTTWTEGWLSEEQGSRNCTDGGTKYGFVVGIECQGDYCDNLRFTCADYNVN
jgi:hypothetical protein